MNDVCCSDSPQGFVCSLVTSHAGPHIARGMDGQEFERWPAPAPVADPAGEVDGDLLCCGNCNADLDLATHDAAVRAAALRETRNDWADYFANWSGAVGPEPLTVEKVIEALRAEHTPFGWVRAESGER